MKAMSVRGGMSISLLWEHGPGGRPEHAISQLCEAEGRVFLVVPDDGVSDDQSPAHILVAGGRDLSAAFPPCDLVVVTSEEQARAVRADTGVPVVQCTREELLEQPALAVGKIRRSRDEQGGSWRGPSLSVCMIAKNEEPNIGRALRSVCGLAREIIVVDTGSTDRTMEIAGEFGATVICHPWTEDFAAARNHALDAASGDWVLVLDADEALTPAFRKGVGEAMTRADVDAFSTPHLNIHGAGTYRFTVLRLLRNGKGYHFVGRVHEQVVPSILETQGRIAYADLPLEHYGYNPEEDRRKQRWDRNRRLLEQGHRESPNQVLYWHYLGADAASRHDHEAAKTWFYKLLREHPEYSVAGMSSHMLAELLIEEGDLANAWDVANVGLYSFYGHSGSLLAMGEVALREGDYVTADRCAQALAELPPSANADLTRVEQARVHLTAGGLWEQGNRSAAVAVWHGLVKEYPGHAWVADLWVRHVAQVDGVRAATADAMREFPTSGAVRAAAMGVFMRAGHWDLAESLGNASVAGGSTLYQLALALHKGDWAQAMQMAESLGHEGAVQLILRGLQENRAELVQHGLQHGLQDAAAFCSALVGLIEAAQQVAPEQEWALLNWMRIAADYRMDDLFGRMGALLAGDGADREAKAALILLKADRPADALSLALNCPDRKEAQAVIGLVAYEAQDWEAAAQFLTRRAAHGHAPVKVYWRGAEALRKLGKFSAARALLMQGRQARPLSLLLSRA